MRDLKFAKSCSHIRKIKMQTTLHVYMFCAFWQLVQFRNCVAQIAWPISKLRIS